MMTKYKQLSNKMLSSVIVLCMLFSCATAFLPAYAAEGVTPTISISNANGYVGEFVDVAISLENNPGIISLKLALTYDAAVLRLTHVGDNGKLGSPTHIIKTDLSSPFIMYWSSGATLTDFMANGEIATLRFELVKPAVGSVVTVSYDLANDDIFNAALQPVYFGVTSGLIDSNVRTYTVVFDSDGGSAVVSQNVVEGEKAVLPVPSPTKGGYNFKEWQLNGVVFDFDTPITAGITLKAVWTVKPVTYTVTYDVNGGSNAPVDSGSPYTSGATVAVLGQSSMVNLGYTFQGWVANSTSGQAYAAGSSFDITGDTVFYAVWQQNPLYTVSYDVNGGTGTIADSSYATGDKVTVSSVVPVLSGYYFAGWLYNGVTYRGGHEFVMPAGDVLLVAQWTQDPVPTWYVSYDGNGGSGVPSSVQYEQGATVIVSSVTPSRSGYSFNGWLYNGITYTAGQTFTMPAASVALVAQWTQNPITYSVIYNANSGTGAPSSGIYVQGATVTVSNTVPSRSGYTFNGWLYDGVTYSGGQTFTMPANNIELVAQWTENLVTYSVTYNVNGGLSAPTDSNKYAQGATVTVASPTPTRSGYIFNGWSYGGNTYQVGQTFTMPATDVTLTAQWTASSTSTSSGTSSQSTVTPKPAATPTPAPSASTTPPSEAPTPSESAPPVNEGFPLWGIVAIVIAALAGIAIGILYFTKKPNP